MNRMPGDFKMFLMLYGFRKKNFKTAQKNGSKIYQVYLCVYSYLTFSLNFLDGFCMQIQILNLI